MNRKSRYGHPPADMLINEIEKLFDDSIRRKSVNYSHYDSFGGNKGFSARHILFFLAGHKDEPVNQLAVVKQTHLTAPTVSVALRNMEEQGLIKREQNPDDLRETKVRITEKGEDFERFIKGSISETEEKMFDGFSDDEIAVLHGFLTRIKNNLTGGMN
jgi:DNA-binding MarR family transcriptional regulator